jgi:methyl-accepting chemotaxis protein
MNWFKSLNVGAKLIGAFLVMIGLMGIVGYIGIANMGKIDAADTVLYERELKGVSSIKEANISLLYQARALRTMLLASSMEDREKSKQAALEAEKRMRKHLDDARVKFVSEHGKDLLKKYDAAYVDYAAARDKMIAMLAAEHLQQDRPSVQFAMTTLRTTGDAVDDLLTQLADLKEKNAKEASDSNNALFQKSSELMLGVIVVAGLVGILLGFLISRYVIVRPMQEVMSAADRLAAGDMSKDLVIDSRDEFGQLKKSMQGAQRAVKAMVVDADTLSRAAVEGRLEVRADATVHQGDFRKIVEGVNGTLDAIVDPVNEIQRILGAMADGDLTQSIAQDYKGDFAQLANSVNSTVARLAETISQVTTAAETLNSAAGQVSSTAQSLSQTASEQAASVEET